MTIDVHAHVLTYELAEALTDAGFTARPTIEQVSDDMVLLAFATGQRFGPIPIGLVDMGRRIADMTRQGVDTQVLASVPMLFGHDQSPEVGAAMTCVTNDALLRIAKGDPDRFHVMASLPMQDPTLSVAEIRRMVPERLVRGVQIAPHIAGGHLDDPALDLMWAELEGQDLPALLHPAPPTPASERLSNYHLGNFIGNPVDSTIGLGQLVFGGVLERFPRLRVGLVHGGGYWPYQMGRWDHGWRWRPEAKAHIDVPPSRFYRQVYCDSLTHDAESLRFLGGRIGWDRVMIGTDYPFDMAEEEPVRALESLGLDGSDHRQVLADTASAFLRPLGGAV